MISEIYLVFFVAMSIYGFWTMLLPLDDLFLSSVLTISYFCIFSYVLTMNQKVIQK